MAIFAIQRAVANEMAFGTVKENLQQRLQDLRKFLKVATEGGSIEFARSTLGKSLLVFMKVSNALQTYVSPSYLCQGGGGRSENVIIYFGD